MGNVDHVGQLSFYSAETEQPAYDDLAGLLAAHGQSARSDSGTRVSIVVPAHRVVRSDGSIGEYGGHPERKRFLLGLEGVRAPGDDALRLDLAGV